MNRSELILNHFEKQGFSEIENLKIPVSILWQPDFVITKNNIKYYVLLRTNNSILPAFLSRISNSSSKYNSIIVFEKKCSKIEENEIISMGISIAYFIDNKLTLKIRTQNKSVAKEVEKKLEVIDIFVSSKQDIRERVFVAERLEALRKINEYPFNPPHLIEYDSFDIRKLNKHIDSIIDKCDWIMIILEENYSKVVKYEIQEAVKKIHHENIFMFVKSTKDCHNNWQKELDFIINLKPPTIKYLPFSDINDLEVTMSRAVHLRMSQIFKIKKIKISD
jgi:hypothetical protein